MHTLEIFFDKKTFQKKIFRKNFQKKYFPKENFRKQKYFPKKFQPTSIHLTKTKSTSPYFTHLSPLIYHRNKILSTEIFSNLLLGFNMRMKILYALNFNQ